MSPLRRAYDRQLDQAVEVPSFRPSSSAKGASSFHPEDFQRRPRATYAWGHPRSSNSARYDHLGGRPDPNGSYPSSRTAGGRRKTGTTGKRNPLEEQDQSSQRIQADSGVWRFIQVFGVFWVVTILTGGFSVNAA